MELLHSHLLNKFADGLSCRVYAEQQYTLLPVVGAMKWLGRICFGRVYVDNSNPQLVTKILMKSLKITYLHVEAKIAEGIDGNSICEQWKSEMDTDKFNYNDYVLFLWNDKRIECDVSLFKSLIDDEDCFQLKSTEYELTNIFYHSFPIFQQHLKGDDYVCLLKDLGIHFPCPDGYIVKSLTIDDTNIAMSSYKFASRIKQNLLLCTANGFGVGAYHVESNELASSVFVNWDGSISALQTVDAHRGKGLAKAVVSDLAALLLKEKLPVYCFIERDLESTETNINLFQKLGFESDFDTVMCWR